MADYDVVIVGANTPGMVAAFYLAKNGGKKVLVIEKSPYVGATAMTVEMVPGFKFHPAGTGEYYIHPQVLAELGLERHGAVRIPANPKLTTVFPDRTHISMYDDVEATMAEFAKWSAHDARAFGELLARWGKIGHFVGMATLNEPLSWGQLAGSMSASPELEELFQDMVWRTIRQVLDRTFENEKVKAAFLPLSEGLLYPPSSAPFFYAVGRFLAPWGFVKGGLKSVADSIHEVAVEQGVQFKLNAEVTEITVRAGGAQGVKLADGTEITASKVITELEPAKTFYGLIGRDKIPPEIATRIDNIPYECPGVTLNLALDGLPDFGIPEDKFNGFIGYYPDYAWGEEAFADFWKGEIPKNLSGIGYVPSYFDPESNFAPAGKHVMTQYVFPVPYQLREGSWETRKDELFEKWIAALELHAPGISKQVVGYGGFTPVELEQKFGMTRGDHQHGQTSWGSDMSLRPAAGIAHYRAPIANLYMGGQSTFPLSGVGGINGRIVANAILADEKKAVGAR